jgi:hypothetical protein
MACAVQDKADEEGVHTIVFARSANSAKFAQGLL